MVPVVRSHPINGLWLTVTHVASYQHVALVAGAAVTAHGVVALMVTPSISLAALIDICKQDGGTVNMRKNIIIIISGVQHWVVWLVLRFPIVIQHLFIFSRTHFETLKGECSVRFDTV